MGDFTETMKEDQNMQEPPWVKLFLQVGFPTALAILLVAALLGWMPSPLMSRLASLEYQGWQNGAVLRAICQNMVKSEEKYRCEPWKAEVR